MNLHGFRACAGSEVSLPEQCPTLAQRGSSFVVNCPHDNNGPSLHAWPSRIQAKVSWGFSVVSRKVNFASLETYFRDRFTLTAQNDVNIQTEVLVLMSFNSSGHE